MDKILELVGYYSLPTNAPQLDYVALKMPHGDFRKSLAVSYSQDDDNRPHVLAYITWRRRDNHKQLWLRADNGSTILGPKIPQTRKTNMSDLASILGLPVGRLTLKAKTGYTGPVRPVGAPKFVSSSVAGNYYLI